MANTRNILIIGMTGSGKSALANVLINKVNENGQFENFQEIFGESAGSVSETRALQIETFKTDGIKYRVIDTVAINKDRSNVEEAKKELEKTFSSRSELSQILFVSRNRFTNEEISFFNWLKDIFDEDVAKYITIVRTWFLNFEDENECKEDFERLIDKSEDREKVIRSCNRVIYVDNPPINIVGGSTRIKSQIAANKEGREKSREILLKHLETCQKVYRLPDGWKKRLNRINDLDLKEVGNSKQLVLDEERALEKNDDDKKTEENTKNKPSWKERRECQLAAATLAITALASVVVPITLKFAGGKG